VPEFETNPLNNLAFQPGDADAELDLCGRNTDDAIAILEDLLNKQGPSGSYFIRFDAADGGGQETLFLPIGRYLLQARKSGRIRRCLPMQDGAGYFIAFTETT